MRKTRPKRERLLPTCGEFLSNFNKSNLTGFGFNKSTLTSFGSVTPQQNANTIGVINVFASIFSLLAGLWMFATNFNVPIVLYLGAALLICNAIWHTSNFYMINKLSKRLNPTKDDFSKQLEDQKTSQKYLQEADFSNNVPNSVTENTTRHLSEEKLKNKSTQSEH